jgi:hypothetical protein
MKAPSGRVHPVSARRDYGAIPPWWTFRCRCEGWDRPRGALRAEKTFEWYTRSMTLLGQIEVVRDSSDR